MTTSTDLITEPQKPNGFALMLTPSTIAEIDKLCETLANSGMVPTAYVGKPKAIAIAGAMGHRLGVDIFSSLAGIAVIQGRPCIWGDLMLAVCQSSPEFGDIEEVFDAKTQTAVCTVTRKSRKPYVTTFSFEDAKIAGLWGKQGPWTTNPKRMCCMRARAFNLRAVFADRLSGFASREEMDDADLLEVQGTVVPDAKPAKSRKAIEDKGPQPGDKLVEAIVKHEETKTEPAKEEPLVVTDAEPATVADLVAMVTNVAKEFDTAGIAEIKALNAHLGIKKTGECPPERVEEAIKLLVAATGRLAEAQGRDGK